MSQDYYRFLVRTITTAGQDPAQLRAIIYHFARSKLRRELARRKDLHWAQIKQQMSALEKAIEQVESDVADHTMFPPPAGAATQLTFFPADAAAFPADSTTRNALTKAEETAVAVREDFAVLERAIEEIEPDIYERPAIVEGRFDSIHTLKPIHAAFWSTIRLVLAVVLGVGLFATIESRSSLRSFFLRQAGDNVASAQPTADGHASQSMPRVASSSPPAPLTVRAIESNPSLTVQGMNMPVPTSYGVYAVSHGKLTDLQTLPIRVPDERVGISAVFSTPSESTLPDGHLQFIVFRRDLVNSAPDRVVVRVVARVMHALTFDKSGNANLVPIAASWAVRSNHYEMQVSPVSGNPEMIIIQPTNPNFVFPAGRYALLLQGTAYDFTVAGKITDTAQCLERTDAVDMPVYSECRTL